MSFKLVIKSHILIMLALAIGSFWLLPPLMTGAHLFDVVKAMFAAVGVGVVISYGAQIKFALTNRPFQGGQFLVLGVTGLFFTLVARDLLNWGWRYYEQPAGWMDHPIIAWLVWCSMIFGALHLLARDAIDGQIPRTNWLYLLLFLVVGALLSVCAVLFLDR